MSKVPLFEKVNLRDLEHGIDEKVHINRDYYRNLPLNVPQSVFFGIEAIPIIDVAYEDEKLVEYKKTIGEKEYGNLSKDCLQILFSKSYKDTIRRVRDGLMYQSDLTIPPQETEFRTIYDIKAEGYFNSEALFTSKYKGTVLTLGSFSGLIHLLEKIKESEKRNRAYTSNIPGLQKLFDVSRYHSYIEESYENVSNKLLDMRISYSESYYRKFINLFVLLSAGYKREYKTVLTTIFMKSPYSKTVLQHYKDVGEDEDRLLFTIKEEEGMEGIRSGIDINVGTSLVNYVENGNKHGLFDYGNYINRPFYETGYFGILTHLAKSVIKKSVAEKSIIAAGNKIRTFLAKELARIYERCNINNTDKNIINQFATNFVHIIDYLRVLQIMDDEKHRREELKLIEKTKIGQTKKQRKLIDEKIKTNKLDRQIDIENPNSYFSEDILYYTKAETLRLLGSLYRSQKGMFSKSFTSVKNFNKWKVTGIGKNDIDFYPNIFDFSVLDEFAVSSYFNAYTPLSDEFVKGIIGNVPFIPYSDLKIPNSDHNPSEIFENFDAGTKEEIWTVGGKIEKSEIFVHSLVWREKNKTNVNLLRSIFRTPMKAGFAGFMASQFGFGGIYYLLGEKHPLARSILSWFMVSHYSWFGLRDFLRPKKCVPSFEPRIEQLYSKEDLRNKQYCDNKNRIIDSMFGKKYETTLKVAVKVITEDTTELVSEYDKIVSEIKNTNKNFERNIRPSEKIESAYYSRLRDNLDFDQSMIYNTLSGMRNSTSVIEAFELQGFQSKHDDKVEIIDALYSYIPRLRSFIFGVEYLDKSYINSFKDIKQHSKLVNSTIEFINQPMPKVVGELILKKVNFLTDNIPTFANNEIKLLQKKFGFKEFSDAFTSPSGNYIANINVAVMKKYMEVSRKEETLLGGMYKSVSGALESGFKYLKIKDNVTKGGKSKTEGEGKFTDETMIKVNIYRLMYPYLTKKGRTLSLCNLGKHRFDDIFVDGETAKKIFKEAEFSNEKIGSGIAIKEKEKGKKKEKEKMPSSLIGSEITDVTGIEKDGVFKKLKKKGYDFEFDVLTPIEPESNILKPTGPKTLDDIEVIKVESDDKLESGYLFSWKTRTDILVKKPEEPIEKKIVRTRVAIDFFPKITYEHIKFLFTDPGYGPRPFQYDNGLRELINYFKLDKFRGRPFQYKEIGEKFHLYIGDILLVYINLFKEFLWIHDGNVGDVLNHWKHTNTIESKQKFLKIDKKKKSVIMVPFLGWFDIQYLNPPLNKSYGPSISNLLNRLIDYTKKLKDNIKYKNYFRTVKEGFEELEKETPSKVKDGTLLEEARKETSRLASIGQKKSQSYKDKSKIFWETKAMMERYNNAKKKFEYAKKMKQARIMKDKYNYRLYVARQCRQKIYESIKESLELGSLSSIPVLAVLFMSARIFEEGSIGSKWIDGPEDPYLRMRKTLDNNFFTSRREGKKIVSYKANNRDQRKVLYELIYTKEDGIYNTLPIRLKDAKWPYEVPKSKRKFNINSIIEFFYIVKYYLFHYGVRSVKFAKIVYKNIIEKIYKDYIIGSTPIDRDKIIDIFRNFFDSTRERKSLKIKEWNLILTEDDLTEVEQIKNLTESEFDLHHEGCIKVIQAADSYRFGNLTINSIINGIDVNTVTKNIDSVLRYIREVNNVKLWKGEKKRKEKKILEVLTSVYKEIKKEFVDKNKETKWIDISVKLEKTLTIGQLFYAIIQVDVISSLNIMIDKANNVIKYLSHLLQVFMKLKEESTNLVEDKNIRDSPIEYFNTVQKKRELESKEAKIIYSITKKIV